MYNTTIITSPLQKPPAPKQKQKQKRNRNWVLLPPLLDGTTALSFVVLDPLFDWRLSRSNKKFRRHLILGDRITPLKSTYFGFNSWNSEKFNTSVSRSVLVDFPRSWVFLDGEAITNTQDFIDVLSSKQSRSSFSREYSLPVALLSCTQIALAPIVERLHNIYFSFGGCIAEIPRDIVHKYKWKLSALKSVVNINTIQQVSVVHKRLCVFSITSHKPILFLYVRLHLQFGTPQPTLCLHVWSFDP